VHSSVDQDKNHLPKYFDVLQMMETAQIVAQLLYNFERKKLPRYLI